MPIVVSSDGAMWTWSRTSNQNYRSAPAFSTLALESASVIVSSKTSTETLMLDKTSGITEISDSLDRKAEDFANWVEHTFTDSHKAVFLLGAKDSYTGRGCHGMFFASGPITDIYASAMTGRVVYGNRQKIIPDADDWYDFAFSKDSPYPQDFLSKLKVVRVNGHPRVWYTTRPKEVSKNLACSFSVFTRLPSENPGSFYVWRRLAELVGPKKALLAASEFFAANMKAPISPHPSCHGEYYLRPNQSNMRRLYTSSPLQSYVMNASATIASGNTGEAHRLAVTSQLLWVTDDILDSEVRSSKSLKTKDFRTPTFKIFMQGSFEDKMVAEAVLEHFERLGL